MKVSIITIVYNNVSCIAGCIQSVLNQTYPNIEHIVIDGGSNDGTREKIESYKNQLAFFESKKDQGLYDALNKGIARVTGDVVGVLHSDDLFYEADTIERVVASFGRSKADLVYANGMYVDSQNTNFVKRIYMAKPFKRRYLPYGWIPLHTTIFVKSEVFQNFGLYNQNFSISGDYEISLRWFVNPDMKTYFLNAYVVKMRLGGKSTSAHLQRKKSMEDLQIIHQYGLPGWFTLACKIGRKIPQYVIPRVLPQRVFHQNNGKRLKK